MSTHLLDVITEEIPQSEPLREDQVPNSAGGFSWSVDNWTHLRRFLILGSEGGSYYASQRDLTKSGLKTIEKCLSEDGVRTVREIVAISKEGLAPKNDYAIFALATAVAKGDDATKREALGALNAVCRIGTHLFQFCEFLNAYGSLTGRAKRRALAKWYTERSAENAAYQAIKYRQRNGWTHRDVLRIAHPGRRVSSGNPSINIDRDHEELFNWIAKGNGETSLVGAPNLDGALKIISGYELAQSANDVNTIVSAIGEYNLPWEALPTEFLSEKKVWAALLENGMPYTALMRNLANMTRIGTLTGTSVATRKVIETLTNKEAVLKSRVHPINILFALKTYASGVGFRGTNKWTPVASIVDALNDAFYVSFKNVEPTNKRILLALDISGSMTWGNVAGTNLTPRDASAAMALVTAATESLYDIVGFSTNLIPIGISPKMRLDTAIHKVSNLPFGGTDCSLPMIWAQKNSREYDAFVVYTDSETWAGRLHPAKALVNYRKNSGIADARLVVVGMVSNNFSIADPKDPGMLDVVGFDSSAPQLISNFIAGKI